VKPIVAPLSTAHSALYLGACDAFDRGDYEICIRVVELAPAAKANDRGLWALLAARCAKALGDDAGWFAAAQIAARDCTSPGDRALGLALAAQAALRAATEAQATEWERRTLAAIAGLRPREIGAARYAIAVYRWEVGNVAGAEEFALANLADGLHEAESTALLGWIASKREDYPTTARLLVAALQKLHEADHDDLRLQARLILGIAVLASETIDFKLARIVEDEFRAMRWTRAHYGEHEGSLNALRYLALLRGDLDAAFAFARQATSGVRPPAYQAIAEIMAGVSARLIGDTNAEAMQFRRAWDILRTERWSQNGDEARGALTYFMLEAGELFPAEARKASVMYRSLAAKVDRGSGLHEDRRVVAFELMATARVAELANDTEGAVAAYEASLEIWQAIGYLMRAAFVALELLRLTGRPAYRKIVRLALARAPKAWFGSDLKKKPKPIESLTRTERVVLAHLLRGKTAREIALALDRSPFTINNHTRKIFAAFEVTSRAKVLAYCVRLGITPASLERSTRA
jgi:DNA-binding CsgD family transcriptional regulator